MIQFDEHRQRQFDDWKMRIFNYMLTHQLSKGEENYLFDVLLGISFRGKL